MAEDANELLLSYTNLKSKAGVLMDFTLFGSIPVILVAVVIFN